MIGSPIVMFSDVNVEQMVSFWLGINMDFVNSYLGMIFNKIGFSDKDCIYVYGYTKDSYLLFLVNDLEEYRILMFSKKVDDKYNPVVYLDKDGNILDGYECIIDTDKKFSIDFNKVRYNDIEGSRIIDLELEYEDIFVSKDGYDIEFRISKVGNGICNKDGVLKYLNDIVMPLSILDIYMGICKISSIKDINSYSLVDLRVIDKENEIEEMIILSDGELVNLLVNNNGRMISCDGLGNYTFENDEVLVNFLVTRNNGVIDFCSKVNCKDNREGYSIEDAEHDINVAKKEITNVKRLVKRML